MIEEGVEPDGFWQYKFKKGLGLNKCLLIVDNFSKFQFLIFDLVFQEKLIEALFGQFGKLIDLYFMLMMFECWFNFDEFIICFKGFVRQLYILINVN